MVQCVLYESSVLRVERKTRKRAFAAVGALEQARSLMGYHTPLLAFQQHLGRVFCEGQRG